LGFRRIQRGEPLKTYLPGYSSTRLGQDGAGTKPALAGGKVYFFLHGSRGMWDYATLYCVDAATGENGGEYPAGATIRASGPFVYTHKYDVLYCFRAVLKLAVINALCATGERQ